MPLDPEAIRKRDDDFWREIIYTDGKLDEESVLKELADYSFLLSQVPLVYDHITGGRMSKVMYCAKDVIAQHDDVDTAERDEAFNEGKRAGKQDALAELTTARARIAGLEAALKPLAEMAPDDDLARRIGELREEYDLPPWSFKVLAADLRRARAALEDKP